MACMRGCWATILQGVRNRSRPIWKMPTYSVCRRIAVLRRRKLWYEHAASAVPDGSRRLPGAHAAIQLPGDVGLGAVSGLRGGCRESMDRGRQRLPRRVQLGMDRRADGDLLLHVPL